MDGLFWVHRSLALLCFAEGDNRLVDCLALPEGWWAEIALTQRRTAKGDVIPKAPKPCRTSGHRNEEPVSLFISSALAEVLQNTEPQVSLRGEDVLGHPGLYLEWKMLAQRNRSCALLQDSC